MAFSEKLKLDVKKKAAFRCVICREPFVEVHHIIPQHEGGPDTLDNAAPLCAAHHDLFGDNPSKRKQIREMRDDWYHTIELYIQEGRLEPFQPLGKKEIEARMRSRQGIAIYHCAFENEDFEASAQILFKLVRAAQQKQPGVERYLFLDIEGHRNKNGGYDNDMFELQKDFALGFLMQYLTEVHGPLIACRNSKPQSNDIPDVLNVHPMLTADKRAKNVQHPKNAPRTQVDT